MKIVLWDTHKNEAQKDYAGGMGVGMHPGTGGIRGRLIRYLYLQDFRPPALNFAYLAAIFKDQGHDVVYSIDEIQAADVYIFNPSLLTLQIEKDTIRTINQKYPEANVLVVGQVAYALADSFSELNAQVIRGEAEQLKYKLQEVLDGEDSVVEVGSVSDLDDLPMPDWSLFDYKKFRMKYDFWKFPTTYIQQSRGCTFKCNYCPYIIVENKTRFRSPDRVVEEIRHGMEHYGFKSFKFRDPLFGLNRKNVLAIADGIQRLKRKVQFSIETRIDLMKFDTLKVLKKAGLTSVTVGIETPDEAQLQRYKRVAINDDRQREFVIKCRELGVRTVAGFMVGFPEDTEQSIYNVLDYARKVNPTYANFNIVTPYPGTQFYEQMKDQIEDTDFANYSVYRPVMKYKNLTSERVAELHGKCFSKYYFRSRYFKENAKLLWPVLNASSKKAA